MWSTLTASVGRTVVEETRLGASATRRLADSASSIRVGSRRVVAQRKGDVRGVGAGRLQRPFLRIRNRPVPLNLTTTPESIVSVAPAGSGARAGA